MSSASSFKPFRSASLTYDPPSTFEMAIVATFQGMISKSAHSSFLERAGWVSEVPLICVISTIGSFLSLLDTYSESNSLPSKSSNLNI